AGEKKDPMSALNAGYYVTTVLSIASLALVTMMMMGANWFPFFICGLIGIGTGLAFVFITQYYTAGAWRPVQEIAQASKTGPATNIIIGTAVGFETTAVTAITISIALVGAYVVGGTVPLPNAAIFGTAVATMGMLMSAAYILAMDTFGPITDNAGGITEMAGAPESARHITDSLDAVGNTTKALTKGYAVGSAGLAAFLLFMAYLDEVAKSTPGGVFETINLAKVEVFVGALLGAMLVFLFSALAIRAVAKTASAVIEEVRRQFRERPELMQGNVRPDYARCVDITARAGLREMVLPGVVAVAVPIIVGVVLKEEAAGAFLMTGTISGILLATVLNNSGGAWDNAKKFIESGGMKDARGEVIKKGSPEHAAGVVGDTIGDPFKDTAGPSLHVLVKLLSTITLVLAPIFI
ncbi:MAG: sodium/proton-translocating pyrophosphatase, partial [Armatimonadetes bacterium]|nr:sodium/proton-translocating pyrophosphatase [Armatimonadota bacterium]